ncbi:hypothetical protein [Massilia sp. YIM B04103]|uniref:hypothetical protein n=1 Tax=Massilia sp. YIM B04103 TaxID=2963106 RepID=UPI0021087C0B|nr:hypothetical protein [Massilia sp. YIM B04103]
MTSFEEALAGNMTTIQLLKSLHKQAESEIIVMPKNIESILQMYLLGERSASELKDWAGFILSSEGYVCPNWDIDELTDRYEPMWEILQQLAMPEIHGQLSSQKIETYLQTLASI